MQTTRLTRLFTIFYVSCACAFSLRAQETPAVSTTPPKSSKGDAPIVITADGQNTYVGEIATADTNVVLKYKADTVFADHIDL